MERIRRISNKKRIMDIKIRLGKREDLPAVHDLVRELAVYEKAEHEFVASLEDYSLNFDAGVFETIVAEVDGRIAGMALYFMTYSTWKGRMLFLEDFVVKEEFRRMGIGKLIFEAFLAEARKKDCRLVKWQVLDWNRPAQDFYRKYNAVIETGWWNGKIFF
jgi:GNAT superfamily N-acetyltransferase